MFHQKYAKADWINLVCGVIETTLGILIIKKVF